MKKLLFQDGLPLFFKEDLPPKTEVAPQDIEGKRKETLQAQKNSRRQNAEPIAETLTDKYEAIKKNFKSLVSMLQINGEPKNESMKISLVGVCEGIINNLYKEAFSNNNILDKEAADLLHKVEKIKSHLAVEEYNEKEKTELSKTLRNFMIKIAPFVYQVTYVHPNPYRTYIKGSKMLISGKVGNTIVDLPDITIGEDGQKEISIDGYIKPVPEGGGVSLEISRKGGKQYIQIEGYQGTAIITPQTSPRKAAKLIDEVIWGK